MELSLYSYVLVMVLIFVASFLFTMLGLGGGMLYVPIIKWIGFPVKTVAIPVGLLLNGLNTLLAFIRYAREGLVDFRCGTPAALAALIFAPMGAHLVRYVPGDMLIILFAISVLIVGLRTIFLSDAHESKGRVSPGKRMLIGSLAGCLGGFIGGLLGLGGGFIIGPALMEIGYPAKKAAATTSYIVTFSSFSGFLGHAAEGRIDVFLAVFAIVAVVGGSQIGAWFMVKKASPGWIKRLFGMVLLLVAIKLLYGIFGSND